jgi:GntR family transcriptional regulator
MTGKTPKTDYFKINRLSNVPLHIQIEAALRQMIQDPVYRAGKTLPDEITLAKSFGVSRNTLRTSFAKLVNDGLLKRVRKRGTQVAPETVMTTLDAWHSFTEEMRRRGVTVVNFKLELIQAMPPEEVVIALGVKPRHKLWCLRRVRGWDEAPGILAVSWFSPTIKITGGEDFNLPLYEVLGKLGIIPKISREQITAEAAEGDTAELLQIPAKTPILVRRRLILTRRRQPIEYNVNTYVGSRYTIALDLA